MIPKIGVAIADPIGIKKLNPLPCIPKMLDFPRFKSPIGSYDPTT